ncbi:hypothetical protein [Crossiella sp. CA198]|uniref:hypothetical protein n=1 Tax=Crossiella sp. CA198 TaxID=3455607 RepID=UPI003F8D31E2
MTRLIRAALVASAALALLTACGPEDPPPAQVAALTTSGSAATTASGTSTATGGAERPQLRLDSSEEEVKRYWAAYFACLKQNGHKMYEGRGGDSPDQRDTSPASQSAKTACAGKIPVQPPELDQQNPEYTDNYRAYLKCMDGKGLKVVPIEPFGSGWNYADTPGRLTEEQRHQVERDCKIGTFSAKR